MSNEYSNILTLGKGSAMKALVRVPMRFKYSLHIGGILKYRGIVWAILIGIQVLIFTFRNSVAESFNGDAFIGDWTSLEGNCDEDVPNGIEVIHVTKSGISWWEIDCHVESVKYAGRAMRAAVSCVKGGGATSAGLLEIQLLPEDKVAFSTRGLTFQGNLTNIYFKCSDSKTSSQRWLHNGSIVSVKVNNSSIEIRYDIPRAGMRMVGAKKGDLLFLGKKDGNSVEGTAFIFNKACGPHPYKADGIMDPNIGTIRLFGEAPILSNKCDVTKSKKDILEFMKIN